MADHLFCRGNGVGKTDFFPQYRHCFEFPTVTAFCRDIPGAAFTVVTAISNFRHHFIPFGPCIEQKESCSVCRDRTSAFFLYVYRKLRPAGRFGFPKSSSRNFSHNTGIRRVRASDKFSRHVFGVNHFFIPGTCILPRQLSTKLKHLYHCEYAVEKPGAYRPYIVWIDEFLSQLMMVTLTAFKYLDFNFKIGCSHRFFLTIMNLLKKTEEHPGFIHRPLILLRLSLMLLRQFGYPVPTGSNLNLDHFTINSK
jgi:hypothetical protein